MNGNTLKVVIVVAVVVLVIGASVAIFGPFNNNSSNNDNLRYYDVGDQIKSTIRWPDDSGVWQTGSYEFTVTDRGTNSLEANVVFNDGPKYLKQNISVKRTGDECYATFDDFSSVIKVGFTWSDEEGVWKIASFVLHDEGKDADIVSRVFELACTTMMSCSTSTFSDLSYYPGDLFGEPEQVIVDITHSGSRDGLQSNNDAIYFDGQLHRLALFNASGIVVSEDPDLINNSSGYVMYIEHIDYQVAGKTWDCLKVTKKIEVGDLGNVLISYYTVDGTLLLKSQVGSTVVHCIDDFK